MDFVYALESYDWDGINLVGIFSENAFAVIRAVELSDVLITRIGVEDKENIDAILSNEGYFVRKVRLNVIYPEKEIIFDSYDYWTDLKQQLE